MTKKYRLLDTFCKAGGAGMGYHLAGFEVVGVDIEPQKRYPFEFHQGDALEFIEKYGKEFDVIHASPPCQAYSSTKSLHKKDYPKLITPTRELLQRIGNLYVIENVVGSSLINPLTLCGTMFGLNVIRHRLFETNPTIWFPPSPCMHIGKTGKSKGEYHTLSKSNLITCVGHNFKAEDGRIAMGIDWMTRAELSQAIPPAYTKWIGEQLIRILENE